MNGVYSPIYDIAQVSLDQLVNSIAVEFERIEQGPPSGVVLSEDPCSREKVERDGRSVPL